MNGSITTSGEDPRLRRMEDTVGDAIALSDGVTLQDVDRDDQSVLEQVVVDHAVEDVDHSIVGCRSEQRVSLVVGHVVDRLLVVAKRAVGLHREVQVEPVHSSVVATEDDVVSTY